MSNHNVVSSAAARPWSPRGVPTPNNVLMSKAQLKAGIEEFIDAHHESPKPFVWTKSADEILANVARFAQRTADARAAQQMSRTMVTGH